jgi:hypothetical protein
MLEQKDEKANVFHADQSIAVVSFLINLGETQDPLFGAVLPSVTKIPKLGEVTTTPALSFGALIAHVNDNSVLRYVYFLSPSPISSSLPVPPPFFPP